MADQRFPAAKRTALAGHCGNYPPASVIGSPGFSALLPRRPLRWRGFGDEGGEDRDLAAAVRACLDRGYPRRHAAVVLGSGERGHSPRPARPLRRPRTRALL